METFSALLAICAGNSPVTGEFPTQRPVTRSFDVFFDLHLNKRLRKQSWGWWFETPSRPLWRHSNEATVIISATEFNTTLVIRGGHEWFYKATISPMRSRLTQYCQAWYMMSFIRGGIELVKRFLWPFIWTVFRLNVIPDETEPVYNKSIPMMSYPTSSFVCEQ